MIVACEVFVMVFCVVVVVAQIISVIIEVIEVGGWGVQAVCDRYRRVNLGEKE